MLPQRECHATLVDLLDRVLDKGLIIHADIMVSVAGIPLIGVNLRAALAGMETMLKYGVMQEWDQKSRAWEREIREKKKDVLFSGEEALLKMPGSCHSSTGLFATRQYGNLYLTQHRLILYDESFGKILFETPLHEIQGLTIKEEKDTVRKTLRPELHLLLKENRWRRLTAAHIHRLRESLEDALARAGHRVQDLFATETETCPDCGNLDFVEILLEKGCTVCGWTSPVSEGKRPEAQAAV